MGGQRLLGDDGRLGVWSPSRASIVWLLMRAPWGRVLKSIREDEDAVRSLGKNVYAYKMQSLIIGGMFGALAGFVVALRSATVGPSFFATDVTFFAYTVLLIGGAARVLRPGGRDR